MRKKQISIILSIIVLGMHLGGNLTLAEDIEEPQFIEEFVRNNDIFPDNENIDNTGESIVLQVTQNSMDTVSVDNEGINDGVDRSEEIQLQNPEDLSTFEVLQNSDYPILGSEPTQEQPIFDDSTLDHVEELRNDIDPQLIEKVISDENATEDNGTGVDGIITNENESNIDEGITESSQGTQLENVVFQEDNNSQIIETENATQSSEEARTPIEVEWCDVIDVEDGKEVSANEMKSEISFETNIVADQDSDLINQNSNQMSGLAYSSIIDQTKNMKNYIGEIDNSDILLAETQDLIVKVYSFENEEKIYLDNSAFSLMGYITYDEYLEADLCLDNLYYFRTVPDAPGEWILVFEGVTPYYGRQAIPLKVHDSYDISIYDWMTEGTIAAGDDPRNIIRLFREDVDGLHILDPSNYIILGFIPEYVYTADGFESEDYTDLMDIPDTLGNWMAVVEGTGEYHGKLTGIIAISEDSLDIKSYACTISVNDIQPEDNIMDYISLNRIDSEGNIVNLDSEYFCVIGYVLDKDMVSMGYQLADTETIQNDVNEDGNWFVIVEGLKPYYGRNTVCVNVSTQKEIAEEQDRDSVHEDIQEMYYLPVIDTNASSENILDVNRVDMPRIEDGRESMPELIEMADMTQDNLSGFFS